MPNLFLWQISITHVTALLVIEDIIFEHSPGPQTFLFPQFVAKLMHATFPILIATLKNAIYTKSYHGLVLKFYGINVLLGQQELSTQSEFIMQPLVAWFGLQ